jgi:large-conductance mechanosensitive channel
MEKISDYLITIIPLIVLVVVWLVIRKILKGVSDKINNSDVYKEDTLKVLEEIRDELKELNKNK